MMFRRFQAISEFNKNAVLIISGTAVAQAISLLIVPLLSRLYLPYDFGILATFLSIVSAIAVLATARYELSIVIPDADEDAANLLTLSLLVSVAISIITFIGVIIFNLAIAPNLDIYPEMEFWLYLLPLFILSLGIYQALSNWVNRRKKYKKLVVYRILNASIYSVIAAIFGFIYYGAHGLLIGTLSGYIIAAFVFVLQNRKEYSAFNKEVSISKMVALAKKYSAFPKVNSLQALSDMFQMNGIFYFLSYFFVASVTGYYALAIRVLQAPMNLMGSAIAQLFYQNASETANKGGDLFALVKDTARKSALLGLPIVITLLVAGPFLFQFIFGDKWGIAGVYARILIPWLYLDFIRASISQLPFILNKHKILFLFSLIGNLVLILSLLYGGLIAEDAVTGLIILSVSESIFTIGIILWLFKISKKNVAVGK